MELGPHNCVSIHLTLVPFLSAAGESKTKPTQHSVKELLESGIQPDVLVLRTEHALGSDIKRKVALFCNVEEEAVVVSDDVSTIYEVPLKMLDEKLDRIVLRKLNLPVEADPPMKPWREFIDRLKNPKHEIHVGLVGKYVELPDAYKSIIESFSHSGSANYCKVNIEYIHSEDINENNADKKLKGLHGLVVAPGFGSRGIDGKIITAKYARENNVPFLGISLGMQCAVVEFARNVLNMEGAHSTEIDPETEYPVIDLVEEQERITENGTTMRLGGYKCRLMPGTKAYEVYGKEEITERHRHRYEFNNKYLEEFAAQGMIVSGINPNPIWLKLLK